MRPNRLWNVLFLAAGVIGCTTDKPPIETPPPPQDSPAHVLDLLQIAYEKKDNDLYPKLLADDFRFYFDPDTRGQNQLPEYWNRDQDSTQTRRLFESTKVSAIRIKLTFNRTAENVNEFGRERWKLINVQDTFLEVDQIPDAAEPEGITFRVDGQIQKFYFRQGKTEGDTLAESPTKDIFYITEWRDFGFGTGQAPDMAEKTGRN